LKAIEDQMQIFENLAKSFVDFDITGENRSFVKELIIELKSLFPVLSNRA